MTSPVKKEPPLSIREYLQQAQRAGSRESMSASTSAGSAATAETGKDSKGLQGNSTASEASSAAGAAAKAKKAGAATTKKLASTTSKGASGKASAAKRATSTTAPRKTAPSACSDDAGDADEDEEPGPSPAAGLSSGAKSATAVAQADAAASSLDPDERRRLWMVYLRSRRPEQSGGRPSKGAGSRSEKMPDELRQAVSSNPSKYFNLWLKCKMSWGEVLLEERSSQKSSFKGHRKRKWLFGYEVQNKFPKQIADALMRSIQDTDDYRPHPQTSDPIAAQYHILLDESDSEVDEDINERIKTFKGKADQNMPSGFLDDLGGKPTAADSNVPTPTPEELAAVETEKRRKKDRRDCARLEPTLAQGLNLHLNTRAYVRTHAPPPLQPMRTPACASTRAGM